MVLADDFTQKSVDDSNDACTDAEMEELKKRQDELQRILMENKIKMEKLESKRKRSGTYCESCGLRRSGKLRVSHFYEPHVDNSCKIFSSAEFGV